MGFEQDNIDELPQLIKKLITVFREYNPLDVFLSLSISELWLPNISSQVKYILVLNVLLTMEIDSFHNNKEIKTYQQFNDFLSSVYHHLPEFPLLEDYIPEQDWSEIKVQWGAQIYKIFYGGSVERITDYIKAFELQYSSYPNILEQMENVLILHDFCLSFLDKKIVDFENNITSGHIEIPTEKFWTACRDMLINLSTVFQTITPKIDKGFIKKFGEIDGIDNSNTLSNLIMTGVAIPAIGININENLYPVSFRSMINVVIECYASKNINTDCSYSLSHFISQRFNNIIEEPFKLCNRNEILPYKFSGLLNNNNRLYLFLSFDINNPDSLSKLSNDISRLLSRGEWALARLSSSQLIGIQNNLGKQPTIDEMEFILISSHTSTVNVFFSPPKLRCKHTFLFLSEFISLFDSINDMKELSSFWCKSPQFKTSYS